MELITSEVIIDRIKRTFKPVDSNWEGDALDIIGEGIDALQSYGIKLAKELVWKDVDVKANRADKPKGDIEFILYEGYLLDKSIARDALDQEATEVSEQENADAVREIESLTTRYETLDTMIENTTDLDEVEELQEKQKEVLDEILEQSKRLNITNKTTAISTEYWQQQGRFIITSFSTGTIRVYSRWYFTDKNGYPMIPDEYNYLRSLYFYFTSELIQQGYENKQYSFADAMQLQEDFGYKAKNTLNRMSPEDRQKMADMLVRQKFNPFLGTSNFRQ